jgi:hypothetical protein
MSRGESPWQPQALTGREHESSRRPGGGRTRARGPGFVVTPSVTPLPPDEGYLVSPVRVGVQGHPDSEFSAPELVCEGCFQRGRKPWNPDGGGVLGRPPTPAVQLYPESAAQADEKPRRHGLFRRRRQ